MSRKTTLDSTGRDQGKDTGNSNKTRPPPVPPLPPVPPPPPPPLPPPETNKNIAQGKNNQASTSGTGSEPPTGRVLSRFQMDLLSLVSSVNQRIIQGPEAGIEDLRSELVKSKKEVDLLKSNLETAQEKCQMLHTGMAALQYKVESATAELEISQKRITKLEVQWEAEKSINRSIRTRMEVADSAHVKQLRDQKAAMDVIEAKNQGMEMELTETKTRLSETEAKLAELAKTDRSTETGNAEEVALRAELDKLRGKVAYQDANFRKLGEMNDDLEEKLAKLEGRDENIDDETEDDVEIINGTEGKATQTGPPPPLAGPTCG